MVFSRKQPITAYCSNYSHILSNTFKLVPQNMVTSSLQIVLLSYFSQLSINLQFMKTSCHGIFLDPCTSRFVMAPDMLQTTHFPLDAIRGTYLTNIDAMKTCGKITKSQTAFWSFTVPRDICVALQIMTPPWQYPNNVTFQYHCKLVVLQNHKSNEEMNPTLHYFVKLFQYEATMVFRRTNYTKASKCESLIPVLPFKREMTGYGDTMSFLFKTSKIQSQSHHIFNPWCPEKEGHVTNKASPLCDRKFYSKSYNSSLTSYYYVIETVRKLSKMLFLRDTGTFSLRLMAWGLSWITIQIQNTCTLKNRYGKKQNICVSQISPCTLVPETRLGWLFRLTQKNINSSLNSSDDGDLGIITAEYRKKGTCQRTPTSYFHRVSEKLRRSQFKDGYFDILLPANHELFHITLSHNSEKANIQIGYLKSPYKDRSKLIQGNCQVFQTPGSKTKPGMFFRVRAKHNYKSDTHSSCISEAKNAKDSRCESRNTTHVHFVSVTLKHKSLQPFSWRGAHERCTHVGGSLLRLESITDMRELIHLLMKFVHEAKFPTYAFYYAIRRQVSIFLVPLF